MKVFYFVGLGTEKFGGLEKFNIELAKRLKSPGDDIMFIYKRAIKCTPFTSALDSLQIGYDSIRHDFVIPKHRKFNWKLFRMIRAYKPDVVHINFGDPSDILAIKLALIGRKCKLVFTQHCSPNLDNKRIARALTLYSRLVDEMLCVSKKYADRYAEVSGRENISAMYLGVNVNTSDRQAARKSLGFDDDTVYIVNIAYHDYVKGVDVLLDAADYLVNTLGVSGFKILQVGGFLEENEENKLLEEFRRRGLEGYMQFVGVRDDIETLMSATDIYCQTSRSEGIPLSIMEAAMASVPIVSTDVGGVSEICSDGENSLLSPSEDYVSIAQNLKRLIEDGNLRATMGHAAKKSAMHDFEIGCQADKLINLYRK